MCTNDAGRTKTTENDWIFNNAKPSSVQSNELLRLSFAFSFTYVAKLNRTVNIEPEFDLYEFDLQKNGSKLSFLAWFLVQLVWWKSESRLPWRRTFPGTNLVQ